MKTLIKLCFLLLLSSLVWSCGGGGSEVEEPKPVPVNSSPSVPSNTLPTNNQLCIGNVVLFQWGASVDAEGDLISYSLQLATNNQFTENVQNINNIITNTHQITLSKGVAYYWRVKAVDNKNAASDYSGVFQFYTESDGNPNYLPFAPSIVAPKLNQIVPAGAAKLEWTASDVDNDPLTYDVYFGTVNPPINKVATNQTLKTFDVVLNASTSYYWKVVVKDNKGGVTTGQIWNFKTN